MKALIIKSFLLIAIIITAVLPYTTVFAEAQLPEIENDVVFVSHTSYISHGIFELPEGETYEEGGTYEGKFLHVVGEVQNVGDEPLSYLIYIRFYDNDGNQVGGPKWELGYSPVIGIAQKYPFKIVLLDEEVSARVADYELSIFTDLPIEKVLESPGWGKSSTFYAHEWIEPFVPTFLNAVLRDGQLIGEFENNDSEDILHFIDDITIWVTYYDEKKVVIAVDQGYIHYLMDLGQKLPFKITSVPRDVSDYSLSVSYERTSKIPYREFRILNSQLMDTTVTGEVQNVGERDATSVEVWATYYDVAGKVINYTRHNLGDLAAGETCSFDFSASLDGGSDDKIENYSLQVTCEQPTLSVSRVFCKVPQSDLYRSVSLTLGENVDVEGQIRGMEYEEYVQGAEVNLKYTSPNGTSTMRKTYTLSDGHFYDDAFKPDVLGEWEVTASWEGNKLFVGAESQAFKFTVKSQEEYASALIDKVEKIIADIKDQGFNVDEALIKLQEAKKVYTIGVYDQAIELAILAEDLASEGPIAAAEYLSMLGSARYAVEKARSEGRTVGLDEAEQLIQKSEEKNSKGGYQEAYQLAEEAKIKAQRAVAPFPYWILVGLLFVIGVFIFVLFWRKREKPAKSKKTRPVRARKQKKLKIKLI